MNRIRLPDVTAEHMPVMPTARMRELRGQINILQAQTKRQIEALEAEIERLTVLEQHKVFAEHKRRIVMQEKKQLTHDLTDAEILLMASEIDASRPFAERALVAAFADCHRKEQRHGR